MPLRISDLIRRAARIVQDVDGTRWDEPEWLDWFNDGRRAMAIVRPTEFARRLPVYLEQGTLQQVPAEAFLLLRIDCNLQFADPRRPGRGVTMVDFDLLTAMHPGWQDEGVFPYAAEVKHFTYTTADPMQFHVFPGNDGTGLVEATVAVLPDEAIAVGEPIGVRAVFANALVDYMLYRAFSKDGDMPGMAERAGSHFGMFNSALGVQATTEAQAPGGGA